jgi:predicted nuclease of predicted toxin-antitoxin system
MPRLFFDEPLSEALCKLIGDIFPDSLHIRLLGQGGAPDATVWDLARRYGCLVVSKDEDFHRLALVRGAPPKFVWIRLGNGTTNAIAPLLRHRYDEIVHFDEQTEATVLELG